MLVSVQARTAVCHGLLAAVFFFVFTGFSQEFEQAQKLFLAGKYDECLKSCERALTDREDWQILRAQTLLQIGRYPEAEKVVKDALEDSSTSLRLRVLGFDTANGSGHPDLAKERLGQINDLVSSRPWAYRDAPNIVALGRAALLMGADPKTILERFLGTAQKSDPNLRDIYLVGGQLALDKSDYALAAKKFSEALKKFPDDPDILCGIAHAYEPSARSKMLELLETALEKNENHVPGMLLLTDHLIDAEDYTEAGKMIERALKVNPWRPEAWAYKAVVAHLRSDAEGEAEARKKALHFWETNPLVDYLIGEKLSQNYRFAEGAACQRRSLEFDPDYLPAKIQLAQDLLRLGEETEGWELAQEVNHKDGYDVTAYNLVSLRGSMKKFQTLTNEDFVLRMSPREAALYGDRALALLQRAKSKLTEKYGITLARPTFVEIFPDQKDFGVRTFGMPHNPGFLGVCFGRVITANSPASAAGNAANWEAVLWHEFCHVVTLQLTKNKMPRWLSEGISVYEELQANPTWGQRMSPRYVEMALGEDLTPVSKLSAAFMSPKSELHVQFAYYESAQVVQFLVERYGFEKLKAILNDLRSGVPINDSIPKHTVPMPEIEKDFAAYIRKKAEGLAPDLSFTKPKRGDAMKSGRECEEDSSNELELFSGPTNSLRSILQRSLAHSSTNKPASVATTNSPTSPTAQQNRPNYWTLLDQARRAIAKKDWDAAKTPLQTLVDNYPDQSGPDNAYDLFATVYRELNETNRERAMLEKWAALDDSAPDAYLRLTQIGESAKDWKLVSLNAERFLAVNPLLPQPYRALGRASEELGDRPVAISAYQKLLLLDPPDPADVHFRLGRLLHLNNDPAAKRQILQALEEAPRFREAHRLLLELTETKPVSTNSPASTQ